MAQIHVSEFTKVQLNAKHLCRLNSPVWTNQQIVMIPFKWKDFNLQFYILVWPGLHSSQLQSWLAGNIKVAHQRLQQEGHHDQVWGGSTSLHHCPHPLSLPRKKMLLSHVFLVGCFPCSPPPHRVELLGYHLSEGLSILQANLFIAVSHGLTQMWGKKPAIIERNEMWSILQMEITLQTFRQPLLQGILSVTLVVPMKSNFLNERFSREPRLSLCTLCKGNIIVRLSVVESYKNILQSERGFQML